MTTSHTIPSATSLHTCLHHYCRFIILDTTGVAYDQPDFHLVFIYYTYHTLQNETSLVFNARCNHGVIDRDNVTYVFTPPTKMSPRFHTRYIYLKYEI